MNYQVKADPHSVGSYRIQYTGSDPDKSMEAIFHGKKAHELATEYAFRQNKGVANPNTRWLFLMCPAPYGLIRVEAETVSIGFGGLTTTRLDGKITGKFAGVTGFWWEDIKVEQEVQ